MGLKAIGHYCWGSSQNVRSAAFVNGGAPTAGRTPPAVDPRSGCQIADGRSRFGLSRSIHRRPEA